MVYTGHVQNGVIVLDSGTLPEGAVVAIDHQPAPAVVSQPQFPMVDFPFQREVKPGGRALTNAELYALMDGLDAPS